MLRFMHSSDINEFNLKLALENILRFYLLNNGSMNLIHKINRHDFCGWPKILGKINLIHKIKRSYVNKHEPSRTGAQYPLTLY